MEGEDLGEEKGKRRGREERAGVGRPLEVPPGATLRSAKQGSFLREGEGIGGSRGEGGKGRAS